MTCQDLYRLESVLDHLPHGICLLDENGRAVALNRKFAATHWYVKTLGPGTSIREILGACAAAGCFLDDPETYVARLLADMKAGRQVTAQREFGDGRTLMITNTPTERGGWVTCQEDVTARVQAERRVAFLARHDSLTELPNRVEFEERLSSLVAERELACQHFAVLCLDFDRFKEVNDRFGHGFGDAFLREVSRRLEAAAGGEFVARVGGDEFTAICADPTDAAAVVLSERFHAMVAGPVEIDGRSALAGISIGVAAFPRHGGDPTTLINNADRALYRAKREGRGITRVFDPEIDCAALVSV